MAKKREVNKRALSRKSRVQFFELLAVILGAGIPISRGLLILEQQADEEQLRHFSRDLRLKVETGEKFPLALKLVGGEKLTQFQLAMMELADETGRQVEICQALAVEDESSWRMERKIFGTLVYPVFVLVLVTLFLVVILPTVVFPQYLQMIDGLHVAEEGLLKPVLAFMRWTQGPWFWFGFLTLGLVGLGMVFARDFRNRVLRSVLKVFLFRSRLLGFQASDLRGEDEKLFGVLEGAFLRYLPPVGRFLQRIWMIRFFRGLAIVFSTGYKRLGKGLEFCFECSGSSLMMADGPEVVSKLTEGSPLSEALGCSRVFPRMALEMVMVGEQSSSVEKMSRFYADALEFDLDQGARDALTLMEPLLIGLMGLVVGAIILLTLYPIVEVIKSL